MLSGRGLCDELITRPEESYRLCCVVVCDLEISRMGAPYIYDISRLRVKLFLLISIYFGQVRRSLYQGTQGILTEVPYLILIALHTFTCTVIIP